MKNPFITRGYAGSQYFCDRERETRDLIDLLTNGNNVALISPRRLGKTDLTRHCFAQPEMEEYYTFLVDIYATASLRDLVDTLGRAILEELKPRGRKVWQRFVNVLHSLRSEITMDFAGNPVWSVGLSSIDNPEVTLDEIFHYLNNADRRCVVAIDEFQQITNYPHGDLVEATLRTYIQRCDNAVFLFSGSRQHLMGKMFSSSSRPFYQSVVTMGLQPISCDIYSQFAQRLFAENGKTLSPDVVHEVYRQFDGVTLCLQRVFNILYMNTPVGGVATLEMANEAVTYIINLLSDNFETQISQLPEKQRSVLFAIAKDVVVKNLSSAEFNKRHRLISQSSTMSAARALVDKEIVTVENGAYLVYDRFLALWLRQQR